VREALPVGSDDDARLAAHVAERLMLSQVAAPIMDRAARMPAETRGPFEGALGSFGFDPRDLAGLVLDVDASRRDTAVWIAWRAGGRGVLPHLRSLFTDTSGPVRRAVLEVLEEAHDPEVHEVARNALQADPSTSVRLAAIRVLAGAPGGVRAAALEHAARDPDPIVRAAVLTELSAGLGAAAVPSLLEALGDPDERVFDAATRQLVAPERDAGEMWAGLDRCRGDRRSRVLEAIEAIEAGRLEALALGRLRSTSDAERLMAVELIAQAPTPACLQGAMDALDDPAAAVRAAAAHALGSLGHPAAIPTLGAALTDPAADVRVATVRALAAVDDRGALRLVVDGLRDPDERVREEVVRVLGALPMGRSTVDLLMDWVAEQGYVIAAQAGPLLERVVGADAFTERLSSLDRGERLRAVQAVAAIGGPLAMSALVGVLGDPDQEVRVRGLRGLGELGDPRAIGAVERTIANDPVREVVSEAQATLRRLMERREDSS
jgi:HEAT repeat protein